MATTSKAKVSLKLLVDTKAKRVIFAEAGKDFVDFLFNLLHLPLATVVSLLTEQTMVGSLGKLYKSIQNLSETYFLSNQTKDYVLKPKASAKRYYSCRNHYGHRYVSEDAGAICPDCKSACLSSEIRYVAGPNDMATAVAEGNFVTGVATYMVTDDLVVTPLSTAATITMFNKLNIKDVGALEERVVDMGMPEGLKLLKASLQSKTVLTSVFLENTAVESPPMLRWWIGLRGFYNSVRISKWVPGSTW
ncbi:hypothetical protein Vadar_033802 [Vaccinium darrowii]|uniref:Uncharacterized protein n=1 Tax=Vaccinium darrowii TaxID=229202 RepID=A0ACB7XM64_9ERIC|nr:hypothetical protein Vadar_033802 [Vaccinium darrowii]